MYKPEWLSNAGDVLLAEWASGRTQPYDVVIVGSGYGGSVAAARLAGLEDKGHPLEVCVLERGREHVPGTFPNNAGELPGHVRFSRSDDPVPGGANDGLFDLRIGPDVSVLLANGLGGGSLINAGVAAQPQSDVFTQKWPPAIAADVADGTFEHWFETARAMLGVHEAPRKDLCGHELGKHVEFVRAMRDLKPEPAQITVSNGQNGRHECLRCGDCATGCNVGAKNTLSTSYLLAAWTSGAKLYTGVTVSHLKKLDRMWEVSLALTEPTRPLQERPLRTILARHVILAAGTFGSTEILMRSKTHFALSLSPSLGQRFSTNGDMISALYKVGERVNVAANESEPLCERHVGPTITGIARGAEKQPGRIVFEELAIPGALRHMFDEIVTTSAMLDRLGRFDWQEHRPISARDPKSRDGAPIGAPATDPAAIDPKIIDGCQILASMGDDGANGSLQMIPGWDDDGNADRVPGGAIRVHWPDAGKAEVFTQQEQILRRIAQEQSWTYLPSPLWQPLPSGISGALSGPQPSGMLFSVHPLGGCAMADRFEDGVVDDAGRVFSGPSGNAVHDGLLVLDGSIIPRALAVNPLLTITALAERAIAKYIALQRWTPAGRAVARAIPQPPDIPREPARPLHTGIRLSERMTGDARLDRGAPQVAAELTIDFEEVKNLAAFLADPLHALHVTGTLKILDRDSHETLAQGDVAGSVELFVRGATSPLTRLVKGLGAYIISRGLADLHSCIDNWLEGGSQSLNIVEYLRGLFALASNVGEVRYLFYDLTLVNAMNDRAGRTYLPGGTTLRGRKTLKYGVGANPWRQLVELGLTARMPDGARPFAFGTLSVDTAYFLRGFASQLQITRQRDLPSSWMDLGSLGLFLARQILKIHFWGFRLPKYQTHDPARDQRRLPGALDPLYMERFVVAPGSSDGTDAFLLLTRYRASKDAEGPPVLMIHGLGSSGIQFTTPRVNPNLAQHLVSQGFDAWVAELRTSIALPSSAQQWTLDQVAHGDVPRLVDFVLEKTGQRQLDIVAHCIGSAMFCTAALAGRLHYPSGESKVRTAALLQVGPLITLSKGTRLRALVAAPLKRFFPNGFVDFSVDDRATWFDASIDRILNTYPYPPDEARYHRLRWHDDTHIANCNRWAGIDGLMIRHENLSDEMLEHMGEILGHSSITTWAQPIQYTFLERLTNSDGTNAYVTDENVRHYFNFPVLFVHGRDNDVFHWLTSMRSQELLLRVHGKRFPAKVKIVDRYRHIDPLIGQNACRDVFPHISTFLKDDHPLPAPSSEAPQYYFRRALIGPLLGWLRWDERSCCWRARVWCRLDDLRSPVSFAMVQVRRANRDPRTYVLHPTEKPGAPGAVIVEAMGTLLWLDVDLGDVAGPYDIYVLSAHEGTDLSPEHREAEFSAGKRLSMTQPSAIEWQPLVDDTLEFDRILNLARGSTDDPGGDEKIDHATAEVPEQRRADSLTFAVASCRYPGWAFDRERADAAFGRLEAMLDDRERPAALFLVGDQIYADATAGVFDPKDRRERFYEAYREAWTARHARNVRSRIPVYMTMDDHEVGDNWHPADFLTTRERRMREEGLHAVRQYQWLISPGNDGSAAKAPRGRQTFWYDFDLHGFPVFVCDARTGRSADRTRMLDPSQFDALATWLVAAQGTHGPQPKLVVSSSVVVPFLRDPQRKTRSDSWDGFVDQLKELFRVIADHRVQNVVFLCGDSHLSNCSEMELVADDKVVAKAYCVVASPMYGPYPFANATRMDFVENNYTDTAPLDVGGHVLMRYRVAASSWVTADGFTRIELSAHQIRIQVGNRCVRFHLAASGALEC